MMRDILFLLGPDFDEGGNPWYCRSCVEIRGLLACYPRLSDTVDVRQVAFPRPRAEIVALLGPEHQGCPQLVIADDRILPDHVPVASVNGRRVVRGARAIGEYFAAAHGIGRPHP